MANDNDIKTLTFTETQVPDVLEVINELAGLEERKPHDSARRLVLEAGKAKIAELKSKLPAYAIAPSAADVNIGNLQSQEEN